MKKGQGLPITTIIIAILAMAVLFVLLFLFLRKGGEFGRATTGCEAQGGGCITTEDCRTISTGIIFPGGACKQGFVCCRAIVSQEKGALCASDEDCISKKCLRNPGEPGTCQ